VGRFIERWDSLGPPRRVLLRDPRSSTGWRREQGMLAIIVDNDGARGVAERSGESATKVVPSTSNVTWTTHFTPSTQQNGRDSRLAPAARSEQVRSIAVVERGVLPSDATEEMENALRAHLALYEANLTPEEDPSLPSSGTFEILPQCSTDDFGHSYAVEFRSTGRSCSKFRIKSNRSHLLLRRTEWWSAWPSPPLSQCPTRVSTKSFFSEDLNGIFRNWQPIDCHLRCSWRHRGSPPKRTATVIWRSGMA
jgi:hypothetical protein